MCEVGLSIKRNDTSVVHINAVKVDPMSLPFLTPRAAPLSGLSGLSFAAMKRRLSAMRAVHRQRTQLALLDKAALEDIGVTPAMVEAETSRPVWDVPPSWRR
jgi:uncharacterized protein YjiS (DUF1127 family)